MIRSLQILALLCAFVVLAAWAALGAHRGWTMTAVPIKKTDPITEIEFVEYDHRFVPGVDFLGAGLIGSGTILAFSFILSKFTKPKS